MSKLIIGLLSPFFLGFAVYAGSQLKVLINWVASNPTMYTESVGYLIPLVLITVAVIVGKKYNWLNIF